MLYISQDNLFRLDSIKKKEIVDPQKYFTRTFSLIDAIHNIVWIFEIISRKILRLDIFLQIINNYILLLTPIVNLHLIFEFPVHGSFLTVCVIGTVLFQLKVLFHL